MKITRIASALMVVASLFTAGCNSFKLSENSSQLVDIKKRAILVGGAETKATTKDLGTTKTTRTVTDYKVCAEPSPDAMSAMAMEAAAKGSVPSKVSVELSAALQQSAAFVGLRTTSIQLLRDFGYRLCEAYLSGAIGEGQYDLLMRRFQKNVVALLAIEQLTGAVKAPPVVLTSRGYAETSQSLFDQQAVREKVSEKIAELEKEKKKKEAERDALLAATPPGNTTELEAQIAEKDAEIKRRKEDLAAIDKGIASARGTLAGGETQATIQADSSTGQPSGQNIQAVAAIVGEIAMAIVKSDDIVQLCLLAQESPIDSKDTTRSNFAKWCLKELQLDQTGRETYLTTIKTRIDEDKKVLSSSSSTAEAKGRAEKDLKDAQGALEGALGGVGGGIYRRLYNP